MRLAPPAGLCAAPPSVKHDTCIMGWKRGGSQRAIIQEGRRGVIAQEGSAAILALAFFSSLHVISSEHARRVLLEVGHCQYLEAKDDGPKQC